MNVSISGSSVFCPKYLLGHIRSWDRVRGLLMAIQYGGWLKRLPRHSCYLIQMLTCNDRKATSAICQKLYMICEELNSYVLAGRAFPLFLDGKWSKNQGLHLFWQKFAEPPRKIILRLPHRFCLPHAEKLFRTVGNECKYKWLKRFLPKISARPYSFLG